MKRAKPIALCGMLAALSIVLMVLGAALEIGMYAAPMLAGLCLLPVGRKYGKGYQATMWAAVSILSLLLVSEPEASLLYLGVFGCYPVIRPFFGRLPKGLALAGKLVYFNIVTVALELLLIRLLVPESMEAGFAAVLLLLGNVVFLLYDFLIPLAERKLARLLP